ncbi:hypothetical protein COY95_00150, partial [Candidatus Woesearchaeota archaeon CG_4_10_14_0_8_um_filter_47_5]
FIENTFGSCIDLGAFRSQGLTIEEGSKEVAVRVSDNVISVDLVYPLTVSKGSAQTKLDSFSFVLPKKSSVSLPIDNGKVSHDLVITTSDGKAEFLIPAGTRVTTAGGLGVDVVEIGLLDKNFFNLDNKQVIGSVVYEGTDGLYFSPPATLTFRYSPEDVEGVDLGSLAVARYSYPAGWVALPTHIFPERYTAVAEIDHFTPIALVVSAKNTNLASETGWMELEGDTSACGGGTPGQQTEAVKKLLSLFPKGTDGEYALLKELKARKGHAPEAEEIATLEKGRKVIISHLFACPGAQYPLWGRLSKISRTGPGGGDWDTVADIRWIPMMQVPPGKTLSQLNLDDPKTQEDTFLVLKTAPTTPNPALYSGDEVEMCTTPATAPATPTTPGTQNPATVLLNRFPRAAYGVYEVVPQALNVRSEPLDDVIDQNIVTEFRKKPLPRGTLLTFKEFYTCLQGSEQIWGKIESIKLPGEEWKANHNKEWWSAMYYGLREQEEYDPLLVKDDATKKNEKGGAFSFRSCSGSTPSPPSLLDRVILKYPKNAVYKVAATTTPSLNIRTSPYISTSGQNNVVGFKKPGETLTLSKLYVCTKDINPATTVNQVWGRITKEGATEQWVALYYDEPSYTSPDLVEVTSPASPQQFDKTKATEVELCKETGTRSPSTPGTGTTSQKKETIGTFSFILPEYGDWVFVPNQGNTLRFECRKKEEGPPLYDGQTPSSEAYFELAHYEGETRKSTSFTTTDGYHLLQEKLRNNPGEILFGGRNQLIVHCPCGTVPYARINLPGSGFSPVLQGKSLQEYIYGCKEGGTAITITTPITKPTGFCAASTGGTLVKTCPFGENMKDAMYVVAGTQNIHQGCACKGTTFDPNDLRWKTGAYCCGAGLQSMPCLTSPQGLDCSKASLLNAIGEKRFFWLKDGSDQTCYTCPADATAEIGGTIPPRKASGCTPTSPVFEIQGGSVPVSASGTPAPPTVAGNDDFTVAAQPSSVAVGGTVTFTAAVTATTTVKTVVINCVPLGDSGKTIIITPGTTTYTTSCVVGAGTSSGSKNIIAEATLTSGTTKQKTVSVTVASAAAPSAPAPATPSLPPTTCNVGNACTAADTPYFVGGGTKCCYCEAAKWKDNEVSKCDALKENFFYVTQANTNCNLVHRYQATPQESDSLISSTSTDNVKCSLPGSTPNLVYLNGIKNAPSYLYCCELYNAAKSSLGKFWVKEECSYFYQPAVCPPATGAAPPGPGSATPAPITGATTSTLEVKTDGDGDLCIYTPLRTSQTEDSCYPDTYAPRCGLNMEITRARFCNAEHAKVNTEDCRNYNILWTPSPTDFWPSLSYPHGDDCYFGTCTATELQALVNKGVGKEYIATGAPCESGKNPGDYWCSLDGKTSYSCVKACIHYGTNNAEKNTFPFRAEKGCQNPTGCITTVGDPNMGKCTDDIQECPLGYYYLEDNCNSPGLSGEGTVACSEKNSRICHKTPGGALITCQKNCGGDAGLGYCFEGVCSTDLKCPKLKGKDEKYVITSTTQPFTSNNPCSEKGKTQCGALGPTRYSSVCWSMDVREVIPEAGSKEIYYGCYRDCGVANPREGSACNSGISGETGICRLDLPCTNLEGYYPVGEACNFDTRKDGSNPNPEVIGRWCAPQIGLTRSNICIAQGFVQFGRTLTDVYVGDIIEGMNPVSDVYQVRIDYYCAKQCSCDNGLCT